MNLGERIYHLRKKKNLSQGELAERLDVSRQSVSKWETNASVPDLDKLIRLGEVFEVTLDALIKGDGEEEGEAPQEAEASDEPDAARHDAPGNMPYAAPYRYAPYDSVPVSVRKASVSATQQGVGFVLLAVGLLTIILLSVMGGFLSGLLWGAPLVACGGICLKCRRRAGLWCSWTLFLVAAVVLRTMTTANSSLIWHFLKGRVEFNAGVLVAMIFTGAYLLLLVGTVWSYRKQVLPWTGRTLAGIIVSGAVFVVTELVPMYMAMVWAKLFQGNLLYETIRIPIMWYTLGLCACELVRFVSSAVLLVLLTGCIRGTVQRRRETRENVQAKKEE
jgi:transcriptional regulator with XRE-family HTH domain